MIECLKHDVPMADCAECCAEQEQAPPPIPNVVEAMLAGDVITVRAWLAHPYIGNGGAMNAAAIFMSDRLLKVTRERDELRDELAAIRCRGGRGKSER